MNLKKEFQTQHQAHGNKPKTECQANMKTEFSTITAYGNFNKKDAAL